MDEEKLPNPARNPPTSEPDEEVVPDPSVDDFFNRMKHDLRRPKPGQEAVTAALHAIQRLGLQTDSESSVDGFDESGVAAERMCHACGSANPGDNRFCAFCGVPMPQVPAVVPGTAASHAPGPHQYHHHYHHHYFSSDGSVVQGSGGADQRPANGAAPVRDPARARAPLGTPGLSRSEAAVRKVTQDWIQACNTKHLHQIVEMFGIASLDPVLGHFAHGSFGSA